MTVVTGDVLVRRLDVRLEPDPARVVNQLFVAGEELSSGASRATTVMQRVLALDDQQVESVLAATLAGFEDRHPHLTDDLIDHFDQIRDRLPGHADLSRARQLLLGAYATNEYSVEAAALCNPSVVPHPDQDGLASGELRIILSLRAVGEGHLSAIEFRTGIVGPDHAVRIDDPGPLLVGARLRPATHDRDTFHAILDRDGDEVVALVLDNLPPLFSDQELEGSIAALHPQVLTRLAARRVVEEIRAAARANYTVAFPTTSGIGQRVLRPHGATETHGMEDARFVRFVDDDGSVTWYATYTAFDGSHIAPQLLRTDDFCTFRVSQLAGRSATNKGLALFPRRIEGRYTALSRWDRAANAVTTSTDGRTWNDSVEVQAPAQPWELIQVGNCGSPIETAEGWLVLTHGVGPMRTYSLGAMLLDLDHPSQVRGILPTPLLTAEGQEREGYVPNVVYSCGALIHNGDVVLPYAYGDRSTSVALVDLDGLLDRLLSS